MSFGAPGGYAAGGMYPPAPVAQVAPEVQQWFSMVDRDRSGRINAQELQAALINGRGENFSDRACQLMISMFDTESNGTVDIYQFERLFNYVNQWLTAFKTYDRDSSGYIDEDEIGQSFGQMGFRFSPEFVRYLVQKSDPKEQKQISVDQFIVLCIQIQRFTEAFRERDTDFTGTITIGFEDFLTVALSCSM